MKHNYSNTDQHTDFFKKVTIPYEKSKEEVWAEMMEKRKAMPQKKSKVRSLTIYYAVAAGIAILIGATAFMRFYTTTVYAPAGQHITKLLPDDSKIHLNANTKATYHPYWWNFERTIELTGEAFFEVTKGKSFSVVSTLGTTRVLGTSFNIFARGNKYRVHCLTGKVEVKSAIGEKEIIEPNQAVIINKEGKATKMENTRVDHVISWTKNTFVFTAAPLKAVFDEMERQFDIQIVYEQEISGTYTGNFKRGSSPEEILNVIARPFGLKVEKTHQTKYKISKQSLD
ncbi:MAG: iron dicitrate transport regulator FecR [Salinivirgaceae bacterium]|nr:MAG: iron dicitrate transport regulator FecR [Salinivirgaceae bacterium]